MGHNTYCYIWIHQFFGLLYLVHFKSYVSFQRHILAYHDRGLLYFQLGNEGILRPGEILESAERVKMDEAKHDLRKKNRGPLLSIEI